MEAALKNQVLDIAVPVLTSDSAVGELHLDFPGSVTIPDQGTIKGQDPNYVQAKCGTGSLLTKATFILGQRDYATKQPIPGTEETIVAPDTTQACTGLAGKAKLGGLKVNGPGAVKNGRKATYKLNVTNWGDGESALTKVCATVPARLAIKPKCRTLFVSQGNPGKGTTSLTIASRGKGKGTGSVKFTISGGGDSVTTTSSLKVKPPKKKKPKGRRG